MFYPIHRYISNLNPIKTKGLETGDYKRVRTLSKYAFKQMRVEIKIAVYIVLFILTVGWIAFIVVFFWKPKEILFRKYRQFVQGLPIFSSVLMLYETIIYMIYFGTS